jgi:hypothetical protein
VRPAAAFVVAIAAATVVLVALLLARVVVRPAGSAAIRRRLPRLVRDQPDFIAGVPWVVRSVVIAVTRAAWATLVFLAVTTIVCVLLMASAVVKGGLHVGSVHIHDISAGVFVGAFVVLGLVFAVVLVAVVGRLWLQQAAAREAAAQRDEAHQQARSSLAVVGWLIVIVVLVPFSYAVILVPLMFVGLFSDAYGDKEHLLARLLVFSLALALGLMGLQAHSPQRFDRLELAIPQHGRSKPLRVRVALIGSAAVRSGPLGDRCPHCGSPAGRRQGVRPRALAWPREGWGG